MRRFRSLSIAFVLASALVAPAGGALAADRGKLDPNVTRALATGLVGPWQQTPLRPGRATVLVELREPATDASLAALRAAGAELSVVEGRVLAYDRFVPAVVTPASVDAVASLPMVARVALASGRGPLPLEQSATLVRLADARGARPALDLVTGKGVTIGDVDSLADPFHPTFFRGDAGYFDWIDVDGDGVFTPGKDAIDLDKNGAAGKGEAAVLLRASPSWGNGTAPVRPEGFDPSIDWLYLDTNGNGHRDYGLASGFDDSVPALGEPLFVPDDVNRNGILDPGERVVRLGTSKFKKIYVNLEYIAKVSTVFERGKNLSNAKVDYSGGKLYGFPDALHATGVDTILVGDVPLVGRRWVGLAPDADLVLAFDVEYTQDGLPVKGVTWALQQKPDVMLHEMAPWTGSPLDGSDALSAMIDASTAKDDVLHTCPTGDQGSARKHAHADLGPGKDVTLPFTLPAATKWGVGPLEYVNVSLNIRGGAASSIVLHTPQGESFDVQLEPQGMFKGGGAVWYATAQTTARGTQYVDVMLYDPDSKSPLQVGSWTVTVAQGNAALSVDAYVSDDKSSWALGAAWDASVATDAATIGIPSVADHCLAVNAEPDHVAAPQAPWYAMGYDAMYDTPPGFTEKQGQVRAYSPRGPRIDGFVKPDVTAPDNPWVAAEHLSSGGPAYGSYRVFGGTSGASPHATAAGALLAEAGLHGDAARDAIRAGAAHDADTGAVPNGDYGYGRLDIAGALGAKATGATPTVTLAVTPEHPTVGVPATLTPTADAGDGTSAGLQAKWDDAYDGTWDAPYAAVAPREVTAQAPGRQPYKVRVRNAAGHIAEAVVWVDFAAAGAGGGGAGGAGGGSASTTKGGGAAQPASAAPASAPADSASGCGCEAAGRGREGTVASALALLGALAIAARKRR
jgi:hypothetical protein